ncbi:XRE family transcriptional regulator [Bacillus mesophilum]|uniref:Helix-turn-helix transcriptional regulator n=1 Tax=Bacillus mesophilum TaxID=1071718 RepID=A0A7V7UWE7_9BACI|nr:XRE family transcriptional regulator [Bacillus mesophilum]KAB2334296.1 helix-turn-helix transcriptional regulator [Bacillus mesophilum]
MKGTYSEMLRFAIFSNQKSLEDIAMDLRQYGFKTNKSQLSKLQNGKILPASNKMNDALAEILNIDSLELKAAAYKEKIPPEILNKIKEIC